MTWRRLSFRERAGITMLAILLGIDQLVQTVAVAPFAILGLCETPDPDETVSSILGRRVADGNQWAVPCAALVDALFLLLTLGNERNHCAHSASEPWRFRDFSGVQD